MAASGGGGLCPVGERGGARRVHRAWILTTDVLHGRGDERTDELRMNVAAAVLA